MEGTQFVGIFENKYITLTVQNTFLIP